MASYTLFVVRLRNNKWLLETVPDKYLEHDIGVNCQLKYAFARTNSPIDICEKIQIRSEGDIDYFVKKYMKFYGIHNVRGGSYTDTVMSDATYHYLCQEIQKTFDTIDVEYDILDSVYKKYHNIHTWDKLQVMREIDRLMQTNRQYRTEKTLLTTMRHSDGKMNRDVLHNINWLCNRIVHYAHNGILSPKNEDGTYQKSEPLIADVIGYKNVLSKLQMLYNIYSEHVANENADCAKFEPKLYLMQPKMIFDTFFYHAHEVDVLKQHCAIAEQMINFYEYAYYRVINRIDELEFDVNSYGENYEQIYEFSLQYVGKYV
jgi:hypothetical protein